MVSSTRSSETITVLLLAGSRSAAAGARLMMSRLMAAVSFPSVLVDVPQLMREHRGEMAGLKEAAGEHQRVPAHRRVGLGGVDHEPAGGLAPAPWRGEEQFDGVLIGDPLAL